MFWPTSPIQRSPVSRSKLNLQGFRNPQANVTGAKLESSTKGLSVGMPREFLIATNVDAQILAKSTPGFWALPSGSP